MSFRHLAILTQLSTLAFGLFILTSCATTDSKEHGQTSTLSPDVPAPFTRSSVLVFDPVIAEKLTVDSQTVEDIDGLYVTHTVFNPALLSSPLTLKAQTFFKNDAGQTIDVSPVREITIEPRKPLVYIAHSPKAQITKFVVYLRALDQVVPSSPQPQPVEPVLPASPSSAGPAASAPDKSPSITSTPPATANTSSLPQVNLQNLH